MVSTETHHFLVGFSSSHSSPPLRMMTSRLGLSNRLVHVKRTQIVQQPGRSVGLEVNPGAVRTQCILGTGSTARTPKQNTETWTNEEVNALLQVWSHDYIPTIRVLLTVAPPPRPGPRPPAGGPGATGPLVYMSFFLVKPCRLHYPQCNTIHSCGGWGGGYVVGCVPIS